MIDLIRILHGIPYSIDPLEMNGGTSWRKSMVANCSRAVSPMKA